MFIIVVLVTGAAGYISSYIIKLLLEEGYKVRGTVRNLNDEIKIKQIKDFTPDVELVEADLLKEETWKE